MISWKPVEEIVLRNMEYSAVLRVTDRLGKMKAMLDDSRYQ